jgi:hypothetical protein
VVYIPEYVVGHWWETLVHNQVGLRLRTRLRKEPGVVLSTVPWQLGLPSGTQAAHGASQPAGRDERNSGERKDEA